MSCAIFLVLAASGCGLSDYQNRMDAQQRRVQRFDELNNSLSDPIDGQATWPFEFYLRLPKGYVLDKKLAIKDIPFIHRYSSGEPGHNIFVAAAWLIDPKAKPAVAGYTAENFRRYMRNAIDLFYFSNYQSDPRFYEQKVKLFLPADKIDYKSEEVDLITPYSEVAPRIGYAVATFSDAENRKQKDHSVFRAYFLEERGAGEADKQVCIIVQRPLRGEHEQFDAGIKAMLGTLDVSAQAASKRAQYKQLKGS
jgi:hypothetical protein